MTIRTQLASTDLSIFPLNLGGNVFGWGADEAASFAVLDAYVEAGGNFIDTADLYVSWVPGREGGESESIIGQWLKSRRNRDDIVLATKVGMLRGYDNLRPENIRACVDKSLRRLGVDHIDLYYAHQDDPGTPQEDTALAFGELVQAGKVRHLGASNFGLERLASAREAQKLAGLATYQVIQNRYNLVSREGYPAELAEYLVAEGMAEVPYHALASGFLTGKHLPGAEPGDGSVRGGAVRPLVDDPRAQAALAVLREVAAGHDATPGATALAWLRTRPAIPAPLASARTVGQLPDLLASTTLALEPPAVAALDEAWS